MPTTPTREEIVRALTGLGDTPDAVATRLRVIGVRGIRGKCSTCPLAEYLTRVFNRTPGSVRITPSVADVYADKASGIFVSVELPHACRRFISAFDDGGYYPELDAQPHVITIAPCPQFFGRWTADLEDADNVAPYRLGGSYETVERTRIEAVLKWGGHHTIRIVGPESACAPANT